MKMKICIDAGHNNSGYDTGATGYGIREQDVTYGVSVYLRELCEKIGVEVICTRAYKEQNLGKDVNGSLDERASLSNFHNCDYFISLHCNAAAAESASGTEVYVCGKGGKAEELAKYIHDEITDQIGTVKRGVKTANYAVLKKTNCPAVLVELAFITNLSDSTKLRTRQEDFANAIFDGFCKFAGMNSKKELITVNDIVWELNSRGILLEKEKWLKKLDSDREAYWLARKFANYIRKF